MKIAVIGATGHAGSAIVQEAQSRGHQVTALVRNAAKAQEMFDERVTIVEKDALALTAADLTDYDAVVDAFATRAAAYQHVDLAARLVAALRGNTTTTLYFILGASSLKQADGSYVIDEVLAKNAGADWVETPHQQFHEYQFLQWIDNVKWTAVSPQFSFVPGPKTKYRIGTDELMLDADGKSVVSTGNLASALLDEMEDPEFLHKRFTVVNA
ncbi:NAD(P)H-binding protein [Lacticaseibacillus yichunensis]|uniref:NAD(P)H-binding protein n=1 Tax=Lacticaseibacillus yichunensis TaxID=2486015 RepID=A0ABW4CU82_9LACO|nr:NAD(P)H-binding protein [Lacticaseibacillus yichunensis]